MQSKSHFQPWIVLGLLACLGPLVNVAQSAPFLFFSAPVGLTNGSDALVSSVAFGGYTFSGEWCLDASCLNGPTGATARLTNLSLTCTNPGQSEACGPVDIRFEADGFTSTGMVQVALSLDGTGFAFGNAAVCIADFRNICPSSLDSPQSVFVNFAGNLNPMPPAMPPDPITFDTSGKPTFDVLGGFHLDGLAAGTTGVSLSNSFKITLTNASPDVGGPGPMILAPEPMTVILLGFGLVSLIVFRKTFGNSTPS